MSCIQGKKSKDVPSCTQRLYKSRVERMKAAVVQVCVRWCWHVLTVSPLSSYLHQEVSLSSYLPCHLPLFFLCSAHHREGSILLKYYLLAGIPGEISKSLLASAELHLLRWEDFFILLLQAPEWELCTSWNTLGRLGATKPWDLN